MFIKCQRVPTLSMIDLPHWANGEDINKKLRELIALYPVKTPEFKTTPEFKIIMKLYYFLREKPLFIEKEGRRFLYFNNDEIEILKKMGLTYPIIEKKYNKKRGFKTGYYKVRCALYGKFTLNEYDQPIKYICKKIRRFCNVPKYRFIKMCDTNVVNCNQNNNQYSYSSYDQPNKQFIQRNLNIENKSCT